MPLTTCAESKKGPSWEVQREELAVQIEKIDSLVPRGLLQHLKHISKYIHNLRYR